MQQPSVLFLHLKQNPLNQISFAFYHADLCPMFIAVTERFVVAVVVVGAVSLKHGLFQPVSFSSM